MPPGETAVEPDGLDINPSVSRHLAKGSSEKGGAQSGEESKGPRLPAEPASHSNTAQERSRYPQNSPREELRRRAISPHGERIVTRGQPHYRRDYPAFRPSTSSSRTSPKSPLMGAEEYVSNQLSPRQSYTKPLRRHRDTPRRSPKPPNPTEDPGQSTYSSRRKDARELFKQHGLSPPSG